MRQQKQQEDKVMKDHRVVALQEKLQQKKEERLRRQDELYVEPSKKTSLRTQGLIRYVIYLFTIQRNKITNNCILGLFCRAETEILNYGEVVISKIVKSLSKVKTFLICIIVYKEMNKYRLNTKKIALFQNFNINFNTTVIFPYINKILHGSFLDLLYAFRLKILSIITKLKLLVCISVMNVVSG